MAQVYVPSVDLVLLIHTGALAAAAVQRALGPWLSSREHLKVLCDCRADAEAPHHPRD